LFHKSILSALQTILSYYRIFWTQDAVLYAEIVNLETQLLLVVEFNRLIVPKFVKS